MRSPRRYGVGFCLLLLVLSLALVGCGKRSVAQENKKLRAERQSLQQDASC